MKNIEKLGRRLKSLRDQRRLTQEQFEELTGINARYLSALERGRKNVTFEVLERVAKGLKVDMVQLFLFDDQEDKISRRSIEKILSEIPEDRLPKILRITQIFAE